MFDKNIHIVVCYASTARKHLAPLPPAEMITFTPTITNAREAADVTVSVESMKLHMIVPPDIEFCIVTKDVFARELTCRLNHYGRIAHWIKDYPFR